MKKASAKVKLRSSVQNESRERLLAGVHDRVKPLTPQASTLSWGPARILYILNSDNNKMKKVTSERQAHFLSLRTCGFFYNWPLS